jgi:hypothetical protein
MLIAYLPSDRWAGSDVLSVRTVRIWNCVNTVLQFYSCVVFVGNQITRFFARMSLRRRGCANYVPQRFDGEYYANYIRFSIYSFFYYTHPPSLLLALIQKG